MGNHCAIHVIHQDILDQRREYILLDFFSMELHSLTEVTSNYQHFLAT